MCISNPILSTQSVFTLGVPQAEGGWGAEQPGGSSQPEISSPHTLPPPRDFPRSHSRPVDQPRIGRSPQTAISRQGNIEVSSAPKALEKERWGDLVERKTKRKGG